MLLIDDVLTTGATCGDAARALKKAGSARVVVVVIARTERTTLGHEFMTAVSGRKAMIRIGTRGSHLARWQATGWLSSFVGYIRT